MFVLVIDSHCALAALFFFAGGICEQVHDYANQVEYRLYNAQYGDGSTNDAVVLGSLEDIPSIQRAFAQQHDTARFEYVGHACNCIAWLLLAMCMVRLAWFLVRTTTTTTTTTTASNTDFGNATCLVLALVTCMGALTELVSSLLYVGLMQSLVRVKEHYDLDDWLDPTLTSSSEQGGGIGWMTLELLRTTSSSLTTWMTQLELLFLAGMGVLVVGVAHSSANDDPIPTMAGWARCGWVVAVLAMVECAADLLQWRQLAIVVAGFHRMILLPLWLVWLGCAVPFDEQGGGGGATASTATRTVAGSAMHDDIYLESVSDASSVVRLSTSQRSLS